MTEQGTQKTDAIALRWKAILWLALAVFSQIGACCGFWCWFMSATASLISVAGWFA